MFQENVVAYQLINEAKKETIVKANITMNTTTNVIHFVILSIEIKILMNVISSLLRNEIIHSNPFSLGLERDLFIRI